MFFYKVLDRGIRQTFMVTGLQYANTKLIACITEEFVMRDCFAIITGYINCQICLLWDIIIFLVTSVFILLSLPHFSHKIGLRKETLVAYNTLQ